MAPEQARGEPIDARADLFSLGSVMYAMCAGRPPFRAETTLAVLRRICDDSPRLLCEVNPDVPAWLAAIIERLLAKSPAERFQSATEVAELLQQWLAHLAQPTLHLPPRVMTAKGPRAATSRRSPPWMVGIAAACAVVVAGAVGVGIGQWFESWGNIAGSTAPPKSASATATAPSDIIVNPRSPPSVPAALSERAFREELEWAQSAITAIELSADQQMAQTRLPADELAELSHQLSVLEAELTPRSADARNESPDNSTSQQGE
jgi:serine/threonine protein kinase